MQRKAKKPVVAIEGRQAFLKSIQLIAIRLVSSKCSVKHDRYFALLVDRENSSITISSDYRLLDVGEETFDVEGEFRWVANNVKSETGLSIGCVYQAHFHADDVIGNRELAKEFAQSEMRLILWPYFRQFAFETSARMSVPPITVPLTTELEKKPGAPGSRRAVRR